MNSNIEYQHPDYDANEKRWELYVRSYLGGEEYQAGNYLTGYFTESENEYARRINLTPIDNHCRNVVHIYSSFLWRTPPVRILNSLANNPSIEAMINDADLDGQSLNSFMKQAQIWSSVYGHVWILVDKPESNAQTRAEELEQEVRPYLSLFTPENVFDWKWERTPSGRFELTYLKLREAVDREDATTKVSYFRIWRKDTIQQWKSDGDKEQMISEIDNPLGKIPAVFVPAARSVNRGIGISDLSDIAYMQRAIYEELSEIEQLIRISNHPSLVKTYDTDASAGAGAVINVPDDMDNAVQPYLLQPSGQNITSIRESIKDKVEAINRMAQMGAVRGTDAVTMSGIAMQTEFQLLNAKLAEKADLLELAEEHLWTYVANWLDVTPDAEVFYPDSFDIRDYDKELMFFQQMRSSGVRSITLMQEIDKKIADLVLDDDKLARSHLEIEQATQALGDFNEKTQIYAYHIDSGAVTPNEVREKIGLEPVQGGDELFEPPTSGEPQ